MTVLTFELDTDTGKLTFAKTYEDMKLASVFVNYTSATGKFKVIKSRYISDIVGLPFNSISDLLNVYRAMEEAELNE